MRFTARQTLKHCLIAVAATLVGLLVMGGTASAAVTEAPDITAQPSNPNTDLVSAFTYKVSDDETSTAATLRYYCRVYDTDGTPPAAGTGWLACGTTTSADPQPASKSYTQANGNWTFEVAVRETTNISTQGPPAAYSWTQNGPVPTKAPVFTSQPEDPSGLVVNKFAFAAGAGEESLVDRFQCRLDSNEESDWTQTCSNGSLVIPVGTGQYSLGNGEHTFQVRAGTSAGWGPASETVTWTVDVPNPEPSVLLGDVSTSSWSRDISSSIATDQGEVLTDLGDVNDDGSSDFAVVSNEPTSDGYVDVLFGSGRDVGDRDFGTQDPREGFRIIPLPSSSAGNVQVYGAGDQNGDGIDDLVVFTPPLFGVLPPATLTVVYGGFSVEDLPSCPSLPVHCLNVADLDTGPDGQGYTLTTSITVGSPVGSAIAAADFDGDGTDDLVINGGGSEVGVRVVKGTERSGTVDMDNLPTDQYLAIGTTLNASDLNESAGYIATLGDLDGDGRDDVYVAGQASGINAVIYGRPFGGDDLDIPTLDPDDGFKIFNAPLTDIMFVGSAGDVNGDGSPDLWASSGNGFFGTDSDRVFTIYDALPARGSGDSLTKFPDMDPATGYVVERGGENDIALGEMPAANIGDFNNDGVPDTLVPATAQHGLDGTPAVGGAYVLFGQRPKPTGSLGVDASLTPDLGVGLIGSAQAKVGYKVASAGDIDGDGLPDFIVNGNNRDASGALTGFTTYVVKGKSLIDQVKTGKAAGVANTSAVLNAGLSTNNRDSEVWFEYGTTDEYGSSTDPESFEASVTGDAASAAVSGLAKATTYHYRAVAKNALGLVRYGDDKTFTTSNVDNPGGDPCAADNTKPGCSGYDPCKADNTKPGCSGYCAANPGKCSTSGPAKLSMITITKKIVVKRGKKGTVQVAVINAGGKAAKGVKVCVKAPKRLVKVKRCTKVGSLGSGASRTVKVKVKAKRKRGKATLKLTATGNGVGKKTAKAKVVVR
ncbi:MAG: hypothetical protein J0H66_08635 [Solirubrobacterales bacterium]|nr:hypothetical protein [Solirubrobacterales bacterium]